MNITRNYDASKVDLFRFPARVIISGPSNAGKTEVCIRLIKHYHKKFSTIVICGSATHPIQDVSGLSDKVIISKDIINPINYKTDPNDHILLILDDCFSEALNRTDVLDLFTKGRHDRISIVFIVQNLFGCGKHARSISLNASAFILFKQRDLAQIEYLGRQIFGKNEAKKFVSIYKDCISMSPYSYLLIDLIVDTPEELQLRSNLFRENGPFETVHRWP